MPAEAVMHHSLPPLSCPLAALQQVGSVNNTFGIKGVAERCFFLKSIEDAHRLRTHIRRATLFQCMLVNPMQIDRTVAEDDDTAACLSICSACAVGCGCRKRSDRCSAS